MKFGVRKINIENSIKARTTGRVKRLVKRTSNPLYGKKGMGFINNPKKAIYNKIYNKTSISAFNLFKSSNNLFYNIFIAFPIFVIVLGVQMLYYCYKYIFLGCIWVVKKIKKLINKNMENE